MTKDPASITRTKARPLPRERAAWLARIALPLIALLCACASTGQSAGPTWAFAMRDVKFPMRDFRFPSGLRVIVEEDHRMPLVAVVSVIGAGSTSDPAGKEGLAHYVEHLTFRAKPDGKATIEGLLGQAGAGMHNATTAFDRTMYYSVGPREALPGLLLVEAGRLMAPVENIAPETAAVEREVVRNELRVRGETGFIGAVLSATQKAVFPEGHAYRRPVIGTHASLSSITHEDARAFTKAHYRPDNTTLVIVGDVELATVGSIIEESLPPELRAGAAAKPAAPRLPAVSPAPPGPPPGPMAREQANVPTPELWIGWSLPRGFDADSVLLEAVTRAARGALPRAFRTDGDISGVGVIRIDGAEASMLLCRVSLHAASHPERSMDRVLDQLVRLWMLDKSGGNVSTAAQQQIESIDFQRFQRTIVTSMLADAEDLVSRAADRALATHFSGEPLTYSRKLGAAMSLSSSAVAEFANRHLTRDRARAVLFTPLDRASAEAVGGVPADPGAEPPPAAPDAETMRAFSRPLGASELTELELPNGLDVIIAERSGLPVVTVGLSFRTGESAVLGADRLAATLAYPNVTTSVVPGQFGASYREDRTKDSYRYFMSGSSGNVSEMLTLLEEWVSNMKVKSESADAYSRDSLGALAAAENWPEARATREFWSALYPGHAYGKTPLAGDLAKLKAGDANDWIQATHVAKNATLVIVGEVSAQAVAETVKQIFGSLPAGQERPAPAALPVPKGAPTRPVFSVVPRAGATQIELSFGCRVPAPAGSLAAHHLAGTLLRERVHERLRRKLGASYGFRVSTGVIAGGSAHFHGQGAIDNAHAAQALTAFKEELAALVSAPPPAAEMDRARWSRLLDYNVSYQSTQDIALALLGVREIGLPRTSLDRYAADLLVVTPVAATELLRACAAGPVLVAVGDEKTARDAFAAAWP